MRLVRRLLLTATASAAALSAIGCRANPASAVGNPDNRDHGLMLHARGTVVSVEDRAHDEQSEDLLPGPHICYTIDSFAEIPRSERAAYESAERTRTVKQGPRCHDTSVDPSAVHLTAGDHLDVFFKLEDGGHIAVVRIASRGVDL